MHKPDFKYYAPGHGRAELSSNGSLRLTGPVPATRLANKPILDAATTLIRNNAPGMKQPWLNAMIWSWFNWLPDYFFEAPASATHKYHPAWADRPDGLLLHSLAVCRVAASLSDILDLPDREYNILIFAAWHHDMFKYGELEKYADGEMTVHEHPVLAGDFFLLDRIQDEMSRFGVSKEECARISDLISTHAGPYRSSRFSALKLPECTGRLNRLLFKSDYIASRKEDGWVQDVLEEIPMPGQ